MRKLINKIKKSILLNAQTLREFYSDGVEIINYIKKNRCQYFSKRGWWLVGCEIPIVLAPNPHLSRVKYMGYLDVVLYNENTEKFVIIDIKTSTKGWGPRERKDKSKQHQLVLYKKFFAEQYNVDINSIDIEFFIVRRKLWESEDFAIKRVQQFRPPSGKTSVNRATKSLNEFLDNCFTSEGFNQKDMPALTNNNCKWCSLLLKPIYVLRLLKGNIYVLYGYKYLMNMVVYIYGLLKGEEVIYVGEINNTQR